VQGEKSVPSGISELLKQVLVILAVVPKVLVIRDDENVSKVVLSSVHSGDDDFEFSVVVSSVKERVSVM